MNHDDQRLNQIERERAEDSRLNSRARFFDVASDIVRAAAKQQQQAAEAEQFSEGRIHRAPPAPINYHEE